MRWKGRRQSTNVDDRRGRTPRRGAAVGGGAALVLLLLSMVFGVDLTGLIGGGGASVPQADVGERQTTPERVDEQEAFLRTILASTEDAWSYYFSQNGQRYQQPTLVLFDDQVQSACGFNSAAVGPFYCPGDQQLYLDTSFFRQLAQLGGRGEFAEAYVVAHEVGHHIQKITGIEPAVRQLQRQARTRADANALSVRMELQADCFAGVWGYYAAQDGLLETGDVEDGLEAAAAIGDDYLLGRSGQPVQPENFTHGTSAQRVEWFRRGLETGDPDACDAFEGMGL